MRKDITPAIATKRIRSIICLGIAVIIIYCNTKHISILS